MFIRKKKKPNGKIAVQIVENVRTHDKTNQKILKHIGQASSEKELNELLHLALICKKELEFQQNPQLSFPIEDIKTNENKEELVDVKNLREETRVTYGIKDVFGKLFDEFSLAKILKTKSLRLHKAFKSCVISRLCHPESKRRLQEILNKNYNTNIPLQNIYRMMDKIDEDEVKRVVLSATMYMSKSPIELMLFDVTTLYFESVQADDLRRFGYSKDNKFKEVQVVLALATTKEGMPLTYEILPGNISEGQTLITVIEDFKKRFDISKVTLVADRAMFSENNLNYLESLNIHYVVAAKLRSMDKVMKEKILCEKDFQTENYLEEEYKIKELPYHGRRLIVTYSKARAENDAKKREKILDGLKKKSKDGETIGAKKLLGNRGNSKFINIVSDEIVIDTEKVELDKRWDGYHGVITNQPNKSAREIIWSYKNLWQIEAAFRVNKHDLRMRPIYHWNSSRIKSHIAICYLGYALVQQAIYRLRLAQNKISVESLIKELVQVQASILRDITTQKSYWIPSKPTKLQESIYRVFGIKMTTTPQIIKYIS